MAIRLSGELPIQEIAAEFGGEAAPNPLSDYYADGVFLSKGYAPNPPAIPNTGSALNIGAFYGKGKKVPITITITANEANVNMFTKFKNSGLMSSYANVDISATLVINSGVTVYGSGIGANAALTVPATDATRTNGFKPTDDIIIQNNGNIVGYYGTGGLGGTGNVAGSAGTNGGVGVLLNAKTRIINNGTIAGGAKGGDGGSGGITVTPVETFCQLYTTTQQPQTTYKCGGKTSYVTASQAQKSTMECNKVCSPCNGAHSIAGRVQTCGCPQNQAQTSYTPVTKAMGYGSCTPKQYTNTNTNTTGGRGGDGASVFSNTVITGGAGGGGTNPVAEAGKNGGLWGGNNWIQGFSNLINSSTIGGTKLGNFA